MSDKADCRHPSDGTCSCGATVAVDRVALWEEINRYVLACGGDPSKHVYGNTPRMEAVSRIENVISNRGVVTDEIGRWIRTYASDPLRGAIEYDRREGEDMKMREDVTESTSGWSVDHRSNVHIRGFYGDAGENEGVLAVIAHRNMTPNHPAHTAIFVGAPQKSPLLPGHIPDLGMFSCSVEGAERLIAELQTAIEIVRAGYKR